jgi:serine phosphatase RsbU (regulator of sigma subunit)
MRKIYLLAFLFPFYLFSQVNSDSLLDVWNNTRLADSARLNAIYNLCQFYQYSVPDSAIILSDLQYNYAKRNGKELYMASALNVKGSIYNYRGQQDLAIACFKESLEITKDFEYEKGRSQVLSNLGLCYADLNDYDKALQYHNESFELDKELNDSLGMAASLFNIAMIYQYQAEYDEAMNGYNKSLAIVKKMDNKRGEGLLLLQMGSVYYRQGNHVKAIEHTLRSLKLNEELGIKIEIANAYNNIGLIHHDQGDVEEAIANHTKSLEIRKEINDSYGIADSYGNLGNIYAEIGKYNLSIGPYKEALKIREEIGDQLGMSSSLNAMGTVYLDLDSLTIAEELFNRSLELCKALDNNMGISTVYYNLGQIKLAQKDYGSAHLMGTKALNIAQEIGVINRIKEASHLLWKVNKAQGKYKDALEMHELYISSKDSISSEENQREIIRQSYKYQYEKQATADSIKAAEKSKLQEAKYLAEKAKKEKIASVAKARKLESKQERLKSYFLLGGLALALVFGFFIFNRFKITQKQKRIIETQKKEVDKAYDQLEEKNTEIMDSISYAKRIQSAILPPMKLVKEKLENSFIICEPKDIVAGDFYWMEPQKDLILFAAADCTGHGVPGAMVSVICNNGLNRSVREHSLTDPGEILDKTREIVIAEFEKSEEEVKDGMDIALCSLSGAEGKQVLKYAGANNPLWIIRKGADSIEEIKANKQPIGKYTDPLPYTTHQVDLNPGDSIYIFSDGFADQFGGAKGKKFKAANFKRLLLSIQDKNMPEQRALIKTAFHDWMGNFEQLDDVCIIGVRI